MRRAHALALAAIIALAGCPAASQDDGTVTPAPVPSLSSPEEAQASLPCAVPTARPPTPNPVSAPTDSTPTPSTPTQSTPTRAPTPDTSAQTSEPPSTPDTPTTRTESSTESSTGTPTSEPTPVPAEGDTVNVTALIDRHDRVLRGHRYELRTPNLFVQSAPGEPALRVRARSTFSAIRHYVVNGTRYSYSFQYGGQSRYSVVPHDVEAFRRGFGSSYSLTGSDWLSDALSVGSYRVAAREEGDTVVLEGELPSGSDDRETPSTPELAGTVDDNSIRSLNATVTIDARGIVLLVEQSYEVVDEDGERRTVERSFRVNDVGDATVERPEWVCIAERNGYLEVP